MYDVCKNTHAQQNISKKRVKVGSSSCLACLGVGVSDKNVISNSIRFLF